MGLTQSTAQMQIVDKPSSKSFCIPGRDKISQREKRPWPNLLRLGSRFKNLQVPKGRLNVRDHYQSLTPRLPKIVFIQQKINNFMELGRGITFNKHAGIV